MRTISNLDHETRINLYREIARERNSNWEALSIKYNVKKTAIISIATLLRKKGVAIPRKSYSTLLTHDFLAELQTLAR